MASLPPEARSGKTPDAATMKLMARLRKIKIKGVKQANGNTCFIVLGSTGRNYEVWISDGSRTGPYSGFPRKCTHSLDHRGRCDPRLTTQRANHSRAMLDHDPGNCVDARTRRHDCKHCSIVILRLGFSLDVTDEEWNAMWRMHLEDAVESGEVLNLQRSIKRD